MHSWSSQLLPWCDGPGEALPRLSELFPWAVAGGTSGDRKRIRDTSPGVCHKETDLGPAFTATAAARGWRGQQKLALELKQAPASSSLYHLSLPSFSQVFCPTSFARTGLLLAQLSANTTQRLILGHHFETVHCELGKLRHVQ